MGELSTLKEAAPMLSSLKIFDSRNIHRFLFCVVPFVLICDIIPFFCFVQELQIIRAQSGRLLGLLVNSDIGNIIDMFV